VVNTGSRILSSSIETLRPDLEKLIGKFQAEKDYYLSGDYREAQARVDFITPFFKSLSWDMGDEAGLPHHRAPPLGHADQSLPCRESLCSVI
jgi:hypothetical protein